MKKIPEQVPEKLYEQILENMPVFCVDMILFHKKKVLLVKRREEPEKGSWWLVGGRVYKNESVTDAVKRYVLKEIGLNVRIIKKVCFYEYRSKESKIKNSKTGVIKVQIK